MQLRCSGEDYTGGNQASFGGCYCFSHRVTHKTGSLGFSFDTAQIDVEFRPADDVQATPLNAFNLEGITHRDQTATSSACLLDVPPLAVSGKDNPRVLVDHFGLMNMT